MTTTFRIVATLLVLIPAGFGVPAHAAETTGATSVVDHYLALHELLAGDNLAGAAEHVEALVLSARGAGNLEAVATAAETLDATTIESLRGGFAGLSIALAKAIDEGTLSGGQLFYCPMADAYWLQAKTEQAARNPYYGASMLRCGGPVKGLPSDLAPTSDRRS